MTGDPGHAAPRTRPFRLRRLTIAIATVALLTALGATSASAASPTACRVRNTDSGWTFTALQAAVDAASPDDLLTVTGTCHGPTIIGKNLAITGIETEPAGRPTLDGDGQGTVVRVLRLITVTIVGLTIEHGIAGPSRRGRFGGGIRTGATLTLRDVVVRGNAGYGIFNTGRLILDGASRISGNDAGVYNFHSAGLTMNDSSAINGNDGGVSNRGRLTMNDRSSIRGNGSGGGGVGNSGILTMNDQSSIRDNTSKDIGGGVLNSGWLTMNDASTISGNTARGGGLAPREHAGGGLYVWGGSDEVLVGVICAPNPDANVFGNTPDDCSRYGRPF